MLFKGLTLKNKDSPLSFVFSWAVVCLHETRLRIVFHPVHQGKYQIPYSAAASILSVISNAPTHAISTPHSAKPGSDSGWATALPVQQNQLQTL